MRAAELWATIVLGVLSGGLMWSAAELPIGWIAGEGPGGGAFPFWLGAGMLACCIWTGIRWWRRQTGPARSGEPFLDPRTRPVVLLVVLALGAMIGLIHIVGVYGALPLFILFYFRVLGRHSWRSSVATALVLPVVTFLFFEVALRITLPKGYTEPLFYPLYDLLM